jgi:hypothetical protein
MRIHYGKYILADDDQAHASAFRVNYTRAVDVANLVQSLQANVRANGNQRLSISFSTTLRFADEDSAARFSAAWSVALPSQDNLIVYWDAVRIIFSAAALQTSQAVQTGVSVLITYTLVSSSIEITGSIDSYELDSGTTAERPESPVTDDVYYDTDLGYDIIWNGTAWADRLGTLV